jgi:hypothetical protein
MFLATDQIGLDVILPDLHCFEGYVDAVKNGEVQVTLNMVAAGYKVYGMMAPMLGRTDSIEWCDWGDVLFKNQYPIGEATVKDDKPIRDTGMNAHPLELMFFKANRGIDDLTLGAYTKYYLNANYTSRDYCHRKR